MILENELETKRLKVSSLFKTLSVREVNSDAELSSDDLKIGNVIDSKYKIDKYLGQGTFEQSYTVLDLKENNT